MKTSWGTVHFPADKGKQSRLIVRTGEGEEEQQSEAWCYLTKSQARKLGERLIKWADKD